jgi:mRNA-degrading endonuclease RelE of RelBE toxin-antitoxin system
MAGYKLRFHPRFVHELEAAISYYDDQSKKVGANFKSATNKQLKLIKKAPHSRSVRYDDVRFARIEKYPYAIHYSIDARNNCVLVYNILCDHRDPDVTWRKDHHE